ncbi:hypothetical protein Tco_1029854 [Tanacetum coccineum]|uniref:Retrovirus-related Pol polyprotein from transposon TNT 1-94-like beta-barrel domain-containing protein n=1 Tax=Tanacetum coccineum TaxID=301880 RepID=A0ABQ5G648_9ASTR
MRMKQYLTHTDYALLEVIVNGDPPAIASASAGPEGLIPPKTAEQKLVRKNELKAKSTLLLTILNEHLLKFHGIKDAKTLWEAIKARSEGLENTSSTNEVVNTSHEVSTASSQGQASSSTYADDVMFSLFANQSNGPQLDNEDLEQIYTDGLEEMDLKWMVAMLTMRVTLLENVEHQGIRRIEMEMVQEGMHQWIHLLQMPGFSEGIGVRLELLRLKKAITNFVSNGLYILRVTHNISLQEQGFNSGCSRQMTGNKSFLIDYQEVDGGFVAFAGSSKRGKITRKGKIRTWKLDFEDVYFVKELKFNLLSVSQMCDKKNSVLFTKTECLVLSPDFKLLDESSSLA